MMTKPNTNTYDPTDPMTDSLPYEFTASEIALDAFLTKLEKLVDKWIFTPLLGASGSASDY